MKIYQKQISIDHQKMSNHMILIFAEENIVKCTISIPFPEWQKYYDENYKYYPLCCN